MVGVYFLVLHQLEANILVPKIMERRVGVSPVAVMVALLVGGALWGLVGAILAIPTAAILSVIVEEVAYHGRDRAGRRIGGVLSSRSRSAEASRVHRVIMASDVRSKRAHRDRHGGRSVRAADGGVHVAAGARSRRARRRRLRRSAAERVDPRVGRHAPRPRLVERQHLLSRTRWRSATPSICRRRRCRSLPIYALTQQSDPLLQPAVPLDVRAVGARHVPVRARADRQRARPRSSPAWRTRSRRTASRRSAPAGAVVGVDAVRAVRIPALLRRRARVRALAGAGGGVDRRRTSRAATTCSSSARRRDLHRAGS